VSIRSVKFKRKALQATQSKQEHAPVSEARVQHLPRLEQMREVMRRIVPFQMKPAKQLRLLEGLYR
jgi:hypothetical protein